MVGEGRDHPQLSLSPQQPAEGSSKAAARHLLRAPTPAGMSAPGAEALAGHQRCHGGSDGTLEQEGASLPLPRQGVTLAEPTLAFQLCPKAGDKESHFLGGWTRIQITLGADPPGTQLPL